MGEQLGRPDLHPVHRPERAGDLKHTYADLARCRAVLGYEPVVGFAAGLGPTLRWYPGGSRRVGRRIPSRRSGEAAYEPAAGSRTRRPSSA